MKLNLKFITVKYFLFIFLSLLSWSVPAPAACRLFLKLNDPSFEKPQDFITYFKESLSAKGYLFGERIEDADAVTWYFYNDAAGDLGIQSKFTVFFDPVQNGVHDASRPLTSYSGSDDALRIPLDIATVFVFGNLFPNGLKFGLTHALNKVPNAQCGLGD